MKRWNGWGNIKTEYPVPDFSSGISHFLIWNPGSVIRMPYFETVLKSVPPTRLPPHNLVDCSPEARLTHARGQSMPDWVALRSGRIGAFPDGVAFPRNEEDVIALMNYAQKVEANIIPYGGGTSVVGHINPVKFGCTGADAFTGTHDASAFIWMNLGARQRFEAGVTGPELEKVLKDNGYTLGHYPQSHEYSTLGGWIATRSSGQQSYKYGTD